MGRPRKVVEGQAEAVPAEGEAPVVEQKAEPKKSTVKEGVAVRMAFLHQSLTWPGLAGTEKSLNSDRIPGIVMRLIPQGLLIDLKGKQCLVPHTNVVNYILEERL